KRQDGNDVLRVRCNEPGLLVPTPPIPGAEVHKARKTDLQVTETETPDDQRATALTPEPPTCPQINLRPEL
ncbi:MAG: hypothetical protein AB7D33_15130, partial [Sphingobium sp.]